MGCPATLLRVCTSEALVCRVLRALFWDPRGCFGPGGEQLRGDFSAWPSGVGFCPGLGVPGGGVQFRGIYPLIGTQPGLGAFVGLLAK